MRFGRGPQSADPELMVLVLAAPSLSTLDTATQTVTKPY